MTDEPTRGERNNNPGNLEFKIYNAWVGLDDPQNDGRFCRFTSALYGIRALARTLMAYRLDDGCLTVKDIIKRWAPPVENNTDVYLSAVCTMTGQTPYYSPTFDKQAPDLLSFVKAIIFHENGRCIYSDDLINQAIQLA